MTKLYFNVILKQEDKTMLVPIILFGFPTGLIFFSWLIGSYADYEYERTTPVWILKWIFSSIGYTILVWLGCLFTVITLGLGGMVILSVLNNR